MEENMSEDDSREEVPSSNCNNSPTTSNKRLKIDDTLQTRTGSRSEESSSSSSNTEQESVSTSSRTSADASTSTSTTDSGFPRSKNSARNRNYRNNHAQDQEANGNDSDEESVPDQDNNAETENLSIISPSSPEHDSSNSTVINDSDHEDDDDDDEEHPTMLKQRPKPSWFVVNELAKRQRGYPSKVRSNDTFRMKCYGSLRSVQRLELMYKMEEHEGCVNSLNFHPDGSLLASGSDDLKIVIWDWKLGKCLLKYDSKHRQNVFQSKFLHLSGDLHVASCARDGQVRIAQISREEGLRDNRKLGSHRGPCNKLAIIPDQPHLILSAGEDGYVLSHDLRQPKPERIVSVKEDERDVALYSINAHPLKTHEFCVSGRDEIVRTYDQRKSNITLGRYHPFKKDQDEHISLHVTCAVYNYNGSEILASYSDEDIYIFDVNAPPGNFLHQYQGHRNGATIKGVNYFGPRSEFIVSGSDCGHLFFWEKKTESIVQWMLADDNGVVNCLEPHPSLPFIATSGLDSDVKVWVPSCENDPNYVDLGELLKRNRRASIDFRASADMNESQMLWMLWRHLRTTNRIRRFVETEMNHDNLDLSSSSSSPSSTEEDMDQDDDDDDLEDGPSGCTTS